MGWFRRNRLTPMPVARSLDELNDWIRSREVQDDQRRIDGRIRTIGQDFAAERPFLAPLPADEFDPDWDMTGVIQDLQALYGVGKDLAVADAWPNWYDGNPFKAARDKMMQAKTAAAK